MEFIKKILKFLKIILFSTKTTAFLFLLFSISLGTATFIEKKYSTDIAKLFIYESTWLEIVMLLISLNLIGNIYKYKLWNKNKFPLLIFHISFILIFLGSIFSRYYSFEGILYLRKGNLSNKITSQKKYIKLNIQKNGENKNIISYYDQYILSPFHNKYEKKLFFNKEPLIIRISKYIPCAKIYAYKHFLGDKIIKIVFSDKGKRIESFIKNKQQIKIQNIKFSFNKKNSYGIDIIENNKKIYFKSPFLGKEINMYNGSIIHTKKNIYIPLKIRHLYETIINSKEKIYWIVPDPIFKGKLKYFTSCDKGSNENDSLSSITADVFFKGQHRSIMFLGGRNTLNMSNPIYIKNYKIYIGYGSKQYTIPFYLYLKKFELKNYPGSNFPSSFISYVTLIDNNKKKNYSIYMNNVLNYKGYKFFQIGYDPDNSGTYLSVNNDYISTYITYFGYILMSIGMLCTLFTKGSRFSYLKNKLHSLKNKNFSILLFIVIFIIFNEPIYCNKIVNDYTYNKNIESVHNTNNILENINVINIPKKHSENFGKLLVQDYKGRIKPINTVAIDLLRKIYRKDTIGNLDANQWFISIHKDNIFWMKIPFIKIDKRGQEYILNKIKKIKYKGVKDYVSMIDLYNINPNTLQLEYLFQEDYKNSFSKNPSLRNEYDKNIIKLSERVGILHEIFQGKHIRIFPIPNDINNTWTSWWNQVDNKLNIKGYYILTNYFKSLEKSKYIKNWDISNKEIDKIKKFQIKYAKNIIPTDNKINAEIIYNKINIFYYLSFLYGILGLIIILNSFFKIFYRKKILNILNKIGLLISVNLFILDTVGLIIRWYISGHAPWTNGFESSIFISWWVVCIGYLFFNNSFVIGITSLISSILLFIAHGSAMDPEITNLVPVLKSPWLIIHVATITSSYGFFLTGSVLGFLVLIFYIFKVFLKSFNKLILNQINKLTIINEICLIIGLFLLTIGTFLGSVWANNSWGRYWSWDPKETWALISILIYAFVLHIRLIPNLGKNILLFNFLSTLSISSIIMTYFGVNYYLSGLHSYAKGDPVNIPYWIYYVLLIFSIITFLAFYLNNMNSKDSNK